MSDYNIDRKKDKSSLSPISEKSLEHNKMIIESKLKESAAEAMTGAERFDFLKTAAEMRKVLVSPDQH